MSMLFDISLEDLDHKFEDIDISSFNLVQDKSFPDGENVPKKASNRVVNVKFKKTPNILSENTPCSTDDRLIETIFIPNESSLPGSFAMNCDEYLMPDTSNGQNLSNSGGGKENIYCEATLGYPNLNIHHIRNRLPNIESNFQQNSSVITFVAATPTNYATQSTTVDSNINYMFDKNTEFTNIQNNIMYKDCIIETKIMQNESSFPFTAHFRQDFDEYLMHDSNNEQNLLNKGIENKNFNSEAALEISNLHVQNFRNNKNQPSTSNETKAYYKNFINLETNNPDEKNRSETAAQKCEHCPNSCKDKSSLVRHLINKHEKRFFCADCDKTFVFLNKLKEHEMKHDPQLNPFKCSYCPIRYKTKRKLQKHINSAHPRKLFICKNCKKSFPTKYILRVHNIKEHNISNFKCEVCTKAFLSNNRLNDHIEKSHTNSNAFPYKCSLCNSNFKSQKAVNIHIRKSHKS